jgi:predicted outer membrane repeat protein
VLVLAGLALMPFAPNGTLLADHAFVDMCNEASFDTALDTVQSTGGGTIKVQCGGSIVFTSPRVITSNVKIVGFAMFDGGGSVRLFELQSGARLELSGTLLQNGSADTGGAIVNAGELSVVGSHFVENSAALSGGAIRNLGTMSLRAVRFAGNTAGDDGGAILRACLESPRLSSESA